MAGHLNTFQSSIGEMQKATGDLRTVRDALDKLAASDLSARYTALIHTPLADTSLMTQVYEQLFAISSVRDAALVVRYSKESRDALDTRFNQTQKSVQALASQLPADSEVTAAIPVG